MSAFKWWRENVSRWFLQGDSKLARAEQARPGRTLRFEPLELRKLLTITLIDWGDPWLGIYWDSGATEVKVSADGDHVRIDSGPSYWILDGNNECPGGEWLHVHTDEVTDLEIQPDEAEENAGDGSDTIDLTAMTSEEFSKPFTEAVIYGGGGADSIDGSFASDSVRGQGGNDKIYGYSGADRLYGNDGNDSLYGGDGADMGFGGDGNDIFEGGAGNDCVDGGGAYDRYVFSGSADLGTDSVSDSGGTDSFDFTTFGSAATVDISSTSTQTVSAGKLVLILGTDYAIENVNGSPYADDITGNSNNNSLTGGGSNDTIDGGTGNDSLYGNDGDDCIDGGAGADYIEGGANADWIDGGADGDLIYGDDGDDYVYLLDGDCDSAYGGGGDDTCTDYDGCDYLSGFEDT